MIDEDTRIEQARARGLTVEETAVELGIHPTRVTAVWFRMDEINERPDRDDTESRRARECRPACGTTAGYNRHIRRHEAVDAECRAASAAAGRRRRCTPRAGA